MSDLARGVVVRRIFTVVFALTLFSFSTAPARAARADLPPPWLDADIGGPALAGQAAESAGTFTVAGAGSDIWGTSDQFHFVYQPVTGDIDVRVQVTGLEPAHPWTKGGVMIREALAADSRHALAVATAAKGFAFQRRVSTGGGSTTTFGGAGNAPAWVRLVRVGDQFTAYMSPDGASWILMGTETIPMTAAVYVGMAVTSHDQNQLATVSFSDVAVQTTQPPPTSTPWTGGDIGSPAIAGRWSESAGTFSVTGAGADIWGGSDQFFFVYQQATGNVELIARVVGLERQDAWSKAGVMIREALTGPAANAAMLGTSANGWSFQRRPLVNGSTIYSPGDPTAPPGWVRLVKNGDELAGYESVDGVTWTLVGTETIPMPTTVYVGLAVTSHNVSAASTATISDVTIRPIGTNTPPAVAMSSPAQGATFTAPATIPITATASDSDGTVTQVDFLANGQLIGSSTTAPYSVSWTGVAAGSYTLTARATDNAGSTTSSGGVTVTVNSNANQPPTVSITSPPNGATYTAPATITINATAADSDGTVTQVSFYQGTTPLATATTSPYSFTWSNVPAGTYSLTASATDNNGAIATSGAVTVTAGAGSQPTTLVYSPSSDHSTNVDSYTLSVFGAADPPDGTPVATRDLGKPVIVNNEITVDISNTVDPLPAGSYYGVVTAVNAGGSTASAPSANFAK